MYRIGVVTGTRAEYGLLKPLMQRIKKDSLLDLYLIVTGAHLEERLGNTYLEIEKDGFHIDQKIYMRLTSDSPVGICASMSKEMESMANAFKDAQMDLIILLGDRYEVLIAAVVATMFNIPIAHIHGGEITEGAIDDAIRHAITKMSQLHFASTAEYANRIVQMGESPDRVFTVGAIGVENIKQMSFYTREELAKIYSPLFLKKYMMVTYHPVTLNEQPALKQMESLLNVLLQFPEYNYIFTYANADKDGSIINEMIDRFVLENNNAAAFKSMGQRGYLSALKEACAVVGNSSSGIIEAPSFLIPTVNIGDRQKGRICGKTVTHCGNDRKEIQAAIQRAIRPTFYQECKEFNNPYEGVNTSDTIIAEIKKALEKGISLQKKFYDLEVSK